MNNTDNSKNLKYDISNLFINRFKELGFKCDQHNADNARGCIFINVSSTYPYKNICSIYFHDDIIIYVHMSHFTISYEDLTDIDICIGTTLSKSLYEGIQC